MSAVTRVLVIGAVSTAFKCAAVYAAGIVFGWPIVIVWFFAQWAMNALMVVDAAQLVAE